jgi:hypothetical protein
MKSISEVPSSDSSSEVVTTTAAAHAFVAALVSLRDSYHAEDGVRPEDINNGCCADFATAIWEQFPEAKVLSDEELGADEYTHSFLYYGGKYFDAEAVHGVDDWRALPIFRGKQ